MWHHHSLLKDTVIFSDYDTTTASLSPLFYVHVTRAILDDTHDSHHLFTCFCKVYNMMKCVVMSEKTHMQLQDTVLYHSSMTCMHCRFYKEYLHSLRHKLHDIPESTTLPTKLKESLPNLNNPVVLLGIPTQLGTTKFSVASCDHLAMVHINFMLTGACCANCKNRECCARMLNKKKVPKQISINQNQNVCGCIQTLHANLELLQDLFPVYLSTPGNLYDPEELEPYY